MEGKVCLRCRGKTFLFSNIAMFYLITSSKLPRQHFEFSLKVKVIGSNPGYLLKSFLLYLPWVWKVYDGPKCQHACHMLKNLCRAAVNCNIAVNIHRVVHIFLLFLYCILFFFILQASKSELQLHRNSHQFLENQSLVMSSHQHHKSESKLLDNSDYNNLIHDTNTEVSLVTGIF